MATKCALRASGWTPLSKFLNPLLQGLHWWSSYFQFKLAGAPTATAYSAVTTAGGRPDCPPSNWTAKHDWVCFLVGRGKVQVVDWSNPGLRVPRTTCKMFILFKGLLGTIGSSFPSMPPQKGGGLSSVAYRCPDSPEDS